MNNSQYINQFNDLYGQIMNRVPFKYELDADPLYQQMKTQYTQQGQQAMMDAIGQASAMTGGYGNSYAQGVGNQAYQQYLTELAGQAPALQANAYDIWQGEGNRLLQLYEIAAMHPEYMQGMQSIGRSTGNMAATSNADDNYVAQLIGALLGVNNLAQDQAAENAFQDWWYYQRLNQ